MHGCAGTDEVAGPVSSTVVSWWIASGLAQHGEGVASPSGEVGAAEKQERQVRVRRLGRQKRVRLVERA